jgi:hypothetical protein
MVEKIGAANMSEVKAQIRNPESQEITLWAKVAIYHIHITYIKVSFNKQMLNM